MIEAGLPCYDQNIHASPMFGPHYFDKHATESSNCNVNEVSNGEPCRLEVNADHRPNFQINEQEEDVLEGPRDLARPFR